MFQISYDRMGDSMVTDAQAESSLYIDKLVVRISKDFLNPNIVSLAKSCRELEDKIHYKLRIAYFEDEELNIVFEMNKDNIHASSIHQLNSIWKKTNNACVEIFQKTSCSSMAY